MAIKTKFDDVVKLKKLKVEQVENELLAMNQKIDIEENKIMSLNEEISNINYPKSGNFSHFLQLRDIMNIEISQIELIKQELKILNIKKKEISDSLKNVKLDYEKIKFLQGEEIKKELKSRAKQESKNMDEIAIMLYKG